jgi:hypothetical protein
MHSDSISRHGAMAFESAADADQSEHDLTLKTADGFQDNQSGLELLQGLAQGLDAGESRYATIR